MTSPLEQPVNNNRKVKPIVYVNFLKRSWGIRTQRNQLAKFGTEKLSLIKVSSFQDF